MPLSEIAGAAGCSKASASDIRRGKWTPHVSTWQALARLSPDPFLLPPVERSDNVKCSAISGSGVVIGRTSHDEGTD